MITEDEALAILPSDGWLTQYVYHGYRNTTSPVGYHIAIGLAILSMSCPVEYGITYAASTLRANIFCMLVGRAGDDQKSTALGIGEDLLYRANPGAKGDAPGSPEGLIEGLQKQPQQILSYSEFGTFLSSAQKGYFEPIKPILCDLWDCLSSRTEILTEIGWKNKDQVRIGERAWSLNLLNGTLELTKLTDKGERDVGTGERMVKFKNAWIDMRVTEGHDIWIKKWDKPKEWVKLKARDLVSYNEKYLLPYAEVDSEIPDIMFLVVDPAKHRPVFVNPLPGETVWCATNKNGTLITRHDNKVTILGNCKPQQRRKVKDQIVRVERPRLSIIAGCSLPYLEQHTNPSDWTGGFLGRWLILYGKRTRIDPFPIPDTTSSQWLVEELQRKMQIKEVGICEGLSPAARRCWEEWFYELDGRKIPEVISGAKTRVPAMALKAALLFAWDFGLPTAGPTWEMDEVTLSYGIAVAELHLKSLVGLSSMIAEHDDARERRTFLESIPIGGGMPFSELLRKLKINRRKATEIMEGLVIDGSLKRQIISGGGGLGDCFLSRPIGNEEAL